MLPPIRNWPHTRLNFTALCVLGPSHVSRKRLLSSGAGILLNPSETPVCSFATLLPSSIFHRYVLIYPGVGKRDIDSILNGYGRPQVQHLPMLLVGRTKCLSSRRWRRATGCSTSCLLPARRCRGRTICSPKVAHLAVRWHTRYTVLSFFTSAPSLIRHSVIARTVRTLSPGPLTP